MEPVMKPKAGPMEVAAKRSPRNNRKRTWTRSTITLIFTQKRLNLSSWRWDYLCGLIWYLIITHRSVCIIFLFHLKEWVAALLPLFVRVFFTHICDQPKQQSSHPRMCTCVQNFTQQTGPHFASSVSLETHWMLRENSWLFGLLNYSEWQ